MNKWPRHSALSGPGGFAAAPRDFQWVEKNIPCQAACPAGTDIPGYLDAIARGRFEDAYRINLRDNVFPAVLGRVCTRPCEPACRHGWEGLGEPVAICFSKRSSDDFRGRGKPVVLEPLFPVSGKKVAVVGAGVAGLAAARELALWGHSVTVYEKHSKPGGMMVQGIPHFRLPRDVVEREIEQVRLTGVTLRCGVEVGRDLPLSQLVKGHDAVILASGTLRPNVPDLPGKELAGIHHGLGFLQNANESGAAAVGANVVVVGGGFTAVDCARTARRAGAKSVRICYRRSETEMYITPGEVEEMRHEGIPLETMVSPVGYSGRDGRVTGVRFVRTQLGAPDASGRRSPVPIPGSEFELPADTVLLGTGQSQDRSWLEEPIREAVAAAGKDVVTTQPGLFLAGDFATGAISLIDAIGHGKKCARAVDRFLTGDDRLADVVSIQAAGKTGRTRDMDFIPRQPMPALAPEKRSMRAEVETGFAEAAAKTEASRCYLCHYKFEIDNDVCIYCDRCIKVKPVEKCIVKVSEMIYDEQDRIAGYKPSTHTNDYNLLYIDQNECIRCGACVEVCPVSCIPVQKVSLCTVKKAGFAPSSPRG
jgi:NADPH-dependent glutamate synthase beta subunit-like oxidoreductase/ferredoxin